MVEFSEENEICLPSFWDNPLKKIPPELHEKLNQNFPNIIGTLALQEDPAHRLYHIVEGVTAIDTLAPLLDLSEDERKKAQMTFRLHDLGHKAVSKGIVTYEEHHLASLYFASKLVDDQLILSAVYNHAEDVLPFDTPLWARLVRDIDRVLLTGSIGIMRHAVFQGFSHLVFDDSLEETMQKEILLDLNHPLSTKFGQKAFEFFFKEVFPFFDTSEKLVDLSLFCKRILERINGYRYSEMWSPPDRFVSLRGIQKNYLDWQIEPVLDVVHRLYIRRIGETDAIRSEAREGYDPREKEDFAEVYTILGSNTFLKLGKGARSG